MIDYAKIYTILLMIVILVFASIFSCLETAIVAIPDYRLKNLQERQMWARYAYKLKLELNQVLIFSLFGNSLFNAAFTTITTVLVTSSLASMKAGYILPVVTLLIAFFIIVFSEALPKIIAAKSPVNVLSYIVIPLYFVFIITKPAIWLIDKIVYAMAKLAKFNADNSDNLDELKMIIADKKMPFKKKHRSILLNSLAIKDITIKEILIPLRMVEAINIKGDIQLIFKQIHTTHHTQIIVYEEKIDNIKGYIHIRDILALEKHDETMVNLLKMIRPIYFISDFIPVIQQIHRAQKYRSRIFMVVNEYGDVLGIVCLEDMLEIVFGDFTTKSPQQQNLAVMNKQQQLIVDGTMLIRELNDLHNLRINITADAVTVNGLLLKLQNAIPKPGVCFKVNDLVFEVLSVGAYWVERVKIYSLKNALAVS